MAGRLLAEKGVHDYVRAANILHGRGVRARFVLLGEAEPEHPSTIPPSYLAAWTREARSNGSAGSTTCRGGSPRAT
jgi:glycosyltransferase involved in cell wall biosynthesis